MPPESSSERREPDVGDGTIDATDPPGPDGYPIVGNSLQIVREPVEFLDRLPTYGDVVRYRVAGNTVTAVLHPNSVERVLVEDADRWTDEVDRPEYAYFPFGGGPRHCIGMRFAMLELQVVVATLAQRFEFDLLSEPDPDLSPEVTLQPANDVRMRISGRT